MLSVGIDLCSVAARSAVDPVAVAEDYLRSLPSLLYGWIMPEDATTGLSLVSGKPSAIADTYGPGTWHLDQATAGKRATIDGSDPIGTRSALAISYTGATQYVSQAATGAVPAGGAHSMVELRKQTLANAGTNFRNSIGIGVAAAQSTLGGYATPVGYIWPGNTADGTNTSTIATVTAWAIATKTFDGKAALGGTGLRRVYVDGALWVTGAGVTTYDAYPSASNDYLNIGTPHGGAGPQDELLAAAFYFSAELAAETVVSVSHAIYVICEADLDGLEVQVDGDSRTYGTTSTAPPANAWPARVAAAITDLVLVNRATAGAGYTHGASGTAIDRSRNARYAACVVIDAMGWNDCFADSHSLATMQTNATAYLTARRTAGCSGTNGKVVKTTLPSSANDALDPTQNAIRLLFNAWVKANSKLVWTYANGAWSLVVGNVSGQWDLCIDFASSPLLTPEATSDGVHYDDDGQEKCADVAEPGIIAARAVWGI